MIPHRPYGGERHQPTAEFWALARAQHFVVTFEQLIELGFSEKWIRHRADTGRLHRRWKGVYAVGRPDVTRHGLFAGAVLACGPGAAISHAHAAELLGIGRDARGPVEISLPGTVRRHPGIETHRRSAFRVTRVHGIPVTTVVQTLVDMAPRLSRDELEAIIGQADQRRLTDPERLRRALDEMPRQPGLGVLKRTLDRRTFVMTHTTLERLFVPLARAAGLPRPLSQRHVGTHRVDFLWHELQLVVEVDGLAYHRTPAQQATDIVRAHANAKRGPITLRFTHEQVRYEPGYLSETLAEIRGALER